MVRFNLKPLRLLGISTNNQPVMGGLFELYDTHGLPLADAIRYLQTHAITPGLHDFIQTAQRHGWPRERAERYVVDACVEADVSVPFQLRGVK